MGVEGKADLHGATVDLAGVQDGATSTFEAAEDGNTGVLKISASTASAGGDVAVSVKWTSRIGASRVWVGALRIQTTTVIAAKELFVNPTPGSDSADGSSAKPFKTIGEAVSMALSGVGVDIGSLYHLVAEAFGQRANLKLLHVPHKEQLIRRPGLDRHAHR